MKKSYQVMTVCIHLMLYTLLMYFYPIFPYHTFTDGTFNFDIVFLLLLLYFLFVIFIIFLLFLLDFFFVIFPVLFIRFPYYVLLSFLYLLVRSISFSLFFS